jgi:hypothetical protein
MVIDPRQENQKKTGAHSLAQRRVVAERAETSTGGGLESERESATENVV